MKHKTLKFLLSFLLITMAIPIAQAEIADVDGSSKTIDMPINAGYGDYGAHGQMVYPQATLENAGLSAGAKISAITFYTANNASLTPSGSNDNPLTIKLGQPDVTTLSGFITEGLTTVSTTGDLWSGNTSVTLQFDNEYIYEGGNLLIDLSWAYKSNGKYKTGLYWLASEVTGAGYLSTNNSSGSVSASRVVNYLPKISITYEEGEASPYAVKVDPTSLDFGKLLVDGNDTKYVTIKNKGTEALNFTISGLNAPFNAVSANGTVAAGEEIQVAVTFAPTTTGSFEGDMVISFPGTDLTDITVRVTGSSSDAICDGTDENEYLPIYGYYYDALQKNQMIYPASILTKYVGKNITALKFYTKDGVKYSGGSYKVSLGTTTTNAFETATAIDATLTTVKEGLSATDGVEGNVLTITFDEPFLYEGNNLVIDFEVVTKGTATSYNNKTYFLGENQSSNTSFYSYVYSSYSTGKDVKQFLPKMDITAEEAASRPVIIVNPASVTINTEPYTAGSATFTVTGTNLTNDINLSVQGNGFAVIPTTIAAADAANGVPVTVTYSAGAVGTFHGTITIISNGAEEKNVDVIANVAEVIAEGTVTPTSLDFGEVLVGQTSEAQLVKVSNTGTDTFTPSFSIDNPAFSIESPSPLIGGQSYEYRVTFTPTAAGVQNGVLTVSFGGLNHTVVLTGVGKELAAYDVTSSAASGVHNFGDAFVGGNATWNVTLTNNGANDVTPVIEGLEAPFTAENVPATLAAGESATITFKFAPTAIQAYGPTSIVVKFNETEDFQFDYTLRGNGIENTGTLPPSTFDNYSYTWTDNNGDEHTSLVSEIATEPEQMIALLREVYTNKNFPGPYYRGYDENGNAETGYPVPYPAIGTVTRFGAFEDPTKYTYNDAYGWGIPHDETAYPFQLLYHNSSSHNHYKALNGNEYKPNEEGLTLLLVEMKDGTNSSTVSRDITSSNTLVNIFDKMFKSVRVITNSKKVTKDGVEGTLFKIDCDKMNRFFFLGKGRLRLMGENDIDNTHLLGRSNYFNDKDNQTSSTQSISNVANDGAPFFEMFEQFSPVSLIEGTESNDVYQQLVNMQSYAVEHDCVYIPWAPAQVSGGEAGHEFNMYGKTSISDDCQDVRDLMFFIPDQRMKDWASRDRGANDKFVNYYEQNAPNMGLYVIRQNEITGEQIDGQDKYRLHLTWDSNLTDFVPQDKGVYYIYQVNDDGTYTKVGETDSQTKELYIDVDMQQHGQQVTYVIQGMDNTGFLSLQFSNEESFIIPGLDENEKFQMMPGAEYYSRYNPADEHNYYANGMQVMAYPDATINDYAGKTFNFFRKAATDDDWTLVGTAQVNNAGTEAAVSMVEATQRLLSDYKFGYKQNPTTVAVTTDANGNKTFGVIFDNTKADVSANEHAASYSYKMEVDGSELHSNVMSIKVYKTEMSTIAGAFTQAQVDNDLSHAVNTQDAVFDIDVEHSSKTEVLRYGAYRWDSSYGTESNPYAILNLNSDDEVDISPSGQASNQGEYYSVYMNGDSYIGEDVYVAQGETGKATFVDNVPATSEEANMYTYAPVVETFTGRADYNTYGAPQQHTASGVINVSVDESKVEQSTYTWPVNNPQYRYYNVFMKVNVADIPEGYELYKVRAWRKANPAMLGEELAAYQSRLGDENGEYLFDEITYGGTNFADSYCKKSEIKNYELGSAVVASYPESYDYIWKGTFGAKILASGEILPLEFTVRAYFTRVANLEANGAQGAPRRDGDIPAVTDANGFYITESTTTYTLEGGSIVTAVHDMSTNREVVDVTYYNMTGTASKEAFNGVNVVVTRYTDGTISTRKVIK